VLIFDDTIQEKAWTLVPVAFERVKKPTQYCDIQTRAVKRKSGVGQNGLMRRMFQTCVNNDLKFR
jgi:hypothetical protein